MYYYGYNGYSNGYPTYYSNGYGYGAAFILVLFILLVIIFGVGFINNNSFTPPNNNGCGCN